MTTNPHTPSAEHPHEPTAPTPHAPGNVSHPPFTCGGCDHTWTGYVMAHCPTCHQTFGSVNSFDRHRKGGTCTPPADIGLFWNAQRRCWSEPYGGTRHTVQSDNRNSDPRRCTCIANADSDEVPHLDGCIGYGTEGATQRPNDGA